MMPINDEVLEKWKALAGAVRPGLWHVKPWALAETERDQDWAGVWVDNVPIAETYGDTTDEVDELAYFIAAARTANAEPELPKPTIPSFRPARERPRGLYQLPNLTSRATKCCFRAIRSRYPRA